MHIKRLHSWDVSVEQAREIQRSLAAQIITHKGVLSPRLIAGVDVSVNTSGEATAAVVVLNYPDLKVVEIQKEKGQMSFPYIPGLLSFREIPWIIRASEKLMAIPDLVLVDGQGIAHPRHMGLASHLGLILNIPTIGCAKSPLYGNFQPPGKNPGDTSDIIEKNGEIIGAVLRTKAGVNPLYISVGHMIDLAPAVQWVLHCCRGYRLPEPTRLAHLASKGNVIEYCQNSKSKDSLKEVE